MIVDAVNDSAPARATWSRAAAATGARLLIGVLALADPIAHRARLEGRSRPFTRIAEPPWGAVEALMRSTEPWGPDVLRLDAARPARELAGSVHARLVSSAPPADPT